MRSFLARAVASAGTVLALAGTAGAQDLFTGPSTAEPLAPGNENWGTSTNIIQTYEASDFELFAGTYGGYDGNAARYCGGAACGWFSGIRVPAGASITAIELDACDTNAAAEVQVALFRNVKGGGATTNLNGTLAGTGVAATPGCATFVRTLAPAETVNNLNNTYFIDVNNTGGTNTTSFKSVRVIYRLQVSPAPGVATFSDVPTTHFAFRFVEAMVASGVTGGCGAGIYCPDSPLTRAQMAIFLATVLGLHFPNEPSSAALIAPGGTRRLRR